MTPLGIVLIASASKLGYMLPLIVVISLVYGATRHEVMEHILRRALRVGAWITVFMILIFAALQFLSMRL